MSAKPNTLFPRNEHQTDPNTMSFTLMPNDYQPGGQIILANVYTRTGPDASSIELFAQFARLNQAIRIQVPQPISIRNVLADGTMSEDV